MKQRIQMTWIFAILFVFLVFVVPAYADPNEVFDWGTNPWPLGPLSQSYTVTGTSSTNFNFTFTGNTNRFLAIPAPPSPQTSTTVTGGTAGPTLFIGADYATTSESIILTIDLSSHATGVSFILMDIDGSIDGSNALQDQVVVIGFGSVSGSVIPTLSANTSFVTVAGNVATSVGTSLVANSSPDANVFVDFGIVPINQIVIEYRPGPLSTNNPPVSGGPDGGGIALSNITFTPSTPTAVSLQSFQAQTPDVVIPTLFAGILLAGFTGVWVVQRRCQLKKVVKPAPVRPTHTP